MTGRVTLFSANLGFLWTDRPLPDAIRAARAAGFDAVECHWPYDTPQAKAKAALAETGLVMLGLNTKRGDVSAGENGLSAVPGRKVDARRAIDEAVDYAVAIGTPNIHVMAGFASGPEARETFVSNLAYACERAGAHSITILIEPLNHYDVPGYFLSTTGQASAIIEQVGQANLKLMFDCYHVQLMEGDLTNRLKRLQRIIGHVQFASVPDRAAPDHGEVNYAHVFQVLASIGYHAPLGAEYNPVGKTEDTLGWVKTLSAG
jgi:hydroxypyruvate isomerase